MIPVIDPTGCNQCGGCIEVAPSVFSMNDLGQLCVRDALLDGYPEEEINEAIAICPGDCISWEAERRLRARPPKRKKPVVAFRECSLCGGCVEVAPSVFNYSDLGFIDVTDDDAEAYPEKEIDEAIAICPGDCISWEEE